MEYKTQQAKDIFIRPNFFGRIAPIKSEIKSLFQKEIKIDEIISNKIHPENVGQLGDISSIQKRPSISSFFSEIIPKKKETRLLAFRVKMKNYEDYDFMLNFLLSKNYRYIIIYEYDYEYYIQISYKKSRRLDNPEIRKRFEFVDIIIDYDVWEELLNNNDYHFIDIKIDVSITYLILKGGNIEKEVYEFYPKLMKFCFKNQIYPFVSFILDEEEEE